MKKENKKNSKPINFEDVADGGDFYENKKFRKTIKGIFIANIVIFAFLCLIIFIIVFLPFIVWLYSQNATLDTGTVLNYLTTCVLIGGPVIIVTSLYGGLLFWVLLVRCIRFEHNGHKIDLYLGVKKIAFAVDGKLVGCAHHGIYSVPHVVWYAKVGDEGVKLEVFKKNEYKIEINWYPVSLQKIKLESDNRIVYGNKK